MKFDIAHERQAFWLFSLLAALGLLVAMNLPHAAYAWDGASGLMGTVAQEDSDSYVLEDDDVTLPATTYEYTAAQIRPVVTVVKNGTTLTLTTDYRVTYQNNREAGTATVTVAGKGSYSGTATKTFEITPVDWADFTVSTNDMPYTGYACEPSLSVKLGTGTVNSQNYTIACENVDVGTATATLTPVSGGSVTGSPKTVTFNITQASLAGITTGALETGTMANGNVTFDTLAKKPLIGSVIYTGSPQSPNLPELLLYTVLTSGQKRYVLTANDYVTDGWTNNVEVGEASITLAGQGNFKDSVTLKCTIEQASIEGADVTVEDVAWTGNAVTPAPVVKVDGRELTFGTDYTVSYNPGDLINVGTVAATISGMGNYKDSATAAFHIRKSLEGAEVSVDEQVYTGQELRPEVTVKLGEDTLTAEQDYTVAYADNTDAGTATVTVTGVDDYMGTATGTFAIVVDAADQSAVDAAVQAINAIGTVDANSKDAVEAARAAYDALSDTQKSLVSDEALSTLTSAETAYAQAAEAKAKEDAAAAAAAEASLANATVKLAKTSLAYTGKALKPAVTVTSKGGTVLKSGTDYAVAYKNNVKVGTATVTVTGKGAYTGSKSATFKVVKASQAISAKAKVTKSYTANKKTKKLAKAKSFALKKVAKVSAKTTVKYKKANKAGGKKIAVNTKTGKVTVKKGLKKGTYKVKVKLTAAANANYKAAKAKTITVVVKVK